MDAAVLYSEVNIVCMGVLLLLALKLKDSVLLQEQRELLFKVIFSILGFLVVDALWIFSNHSLVALAREWNWVLSALYYGIGAFAGYYYFLFSETVQGSKLVRNPRYRNLARLPLLLLWGLIVLSLHTGWLFYIDEHNVYHRGPLFILQIIASYGYIVFTALKASHYSYYVEDYRGKSELKTLATFVLLTLVCGSLQIIFSSYPVLCIGNTLGILYIYLTFQERLISLDALTKLNNRNQLLVHLSHRLLGNSNKENLYLLMMDVDYFKKVNDRYGHIEGDEALRVVGRTLMSVAGHRRCFLARFGGDEFVLIGELASPQEVQELCTEINTKLAEYEAPYKLAVSIGVARWTPAIKTIQDFIAAADDKLYEVKRKRVPSTDA